MNKFLLFSILLLLFSCQKKSQEDKNKADQEIKTNDKVVATKLGRKDPITINSKTGQRLSQKEIKSTFTKRIKRNLDIKYPIYETYTYKDGSGTHYLVLTDRIHKISDQNDTIFNAIKAYSLSYIDKKFRKRATIKDVIDDSWETSIGFWNKYSELADFDQDGHTDLILVYGTTGQDMYADGRVKIMIYYNHKRIAIRHQNSEYGGRLTKISSTFYTLPKVIQETVITKIRLMTQNGHAVLEKGWEKKIKEKARRIE